nr:MAG TPA: hypothetical protein [Caudoviricetes sp.]DAW45418.1 MAG TPA: hypothetical protein [Bacteriophage sp.]
MSYSFPTKTELKKSLYLFYLLLYILYIYRHV